MRLFVTYIPIYIAGAGIGGLTAALALAQNGTKVEILERSDSLSEIGAGLQLGPNAMHVLSALGLKERVEAVAFEPNSIEFRDFKTGKSLLSNRLKAVHEVRYGQKYLHIHRGDLQNILLTAVKEQNIPVHLGHEVTQYKQINGTVHVTTNTQEFAADLLIGADGIKSNIRHQMFGKQEISYTGHVAWRGLVETKKLPPNFIPPCANNWLGPKRHFVAYYVKGGKFINFVAIEEREAWTEEGWSQKGGLDDLRAAFKGWDTRVTTLLDACKDCYLWGLFDHPPLPSWIEGRVALMGDAAHPMLPFLAQGAAMAIEDAWVLAQCIKQSSNWPSALKAFESIRYDRATFIQKSSSDNAKLYHAGSRLGTLWRNSKFKIATHIPAAAHSRLDKIFGEDVTKAPPSFLSENMN